MIYTNPKRCFTNAQTPVKILKKKGTGTGCGVRVRKEDLFI